MQSREDDPRLKAPIFGSSDDATLLKLLANYIDFNLDEIAESCRKEQYNYDYFLKHKNHRKKAAVLNFAGTCYRAHHFFSQSDSRRAIRFQGLIGAYSSPLDSFQLDQWGEIRDRLKRDPGLLTVRASLYFPIRYKFVDCTLWQMALMSDDGDHAYDFFKLCFKDLPDGLKIMADQYREVFPEGEVKHKGWDLEQAKHLVNAAVDAMCKDNGIVADADVRVDEFVIYFTMDEATRKALAAMYGYITPKNFSKGDQFVPGISFDERLCEYALSKYQAVVSQLDFDKKLFFSMKIWDALVMRLSTGCLRYLQRGAGNSAHRLSNRTFCEDIDNESKPYYRRSSSSEIDVLHGDSRLLSWIDPLLDGSRYFSIRGERESAGLGISYGLNQRTNQFAEPLKCLRETGKLYDSYLDSPEKFSEVMSVRRANREAFEMHMEHLWQTHCNDQGKAAEESCKLARTR